jgi:hypothetical protein
MVEYGMLMMLQDIPSDSAKAEDIFRHLDAKEGLLEQEIVAFIATNKGAHAYPRSEIERLLQLKQLPSLVGRPSHHP